MQFHSNPRSIQASTPEKRDPYLARAEEQAVHQQLLKPTRKHLQLRTGNKKQLIVTKRFHLVTVRLSKDQRNQVFGVLKAGSMVNDIAHHFGCPRQTIHYLMILYNRTGYVRVHARPGHARVTTWRSYRVNTLTHQRNRFKRQQLLLVFTGFMHIR